MGYVVLIIIALSLIAWLAYSIYQSGGTFAAAWRRMSQWERTCLWSGAILYLAIPLFSEPPQGGEYIVGVMSTLIDTLANGLFIVGAVAFLQRGHEIEQEKRSSAQQGAQADGPASDGPAA